MGFLKQRTLFTEDEELKVGLERAKNLWRKRTYINSQWKETNERRRENNIEVIESLLNHHKVNGKLTSPQRELAKRLIDNANKK